MKILGEHVVDTMVIDQQNIEKIMFSLKWKIIRVKYWKKKKRSKFLPAKSKVAHEKVYEVFTQWKKEKGVNEVTEDMILAYLDERVSSTCFVLQQNAWFEWNVFKVGEIMLLYGRNITMYKYLLETIWWVGILKNRGIIYWKLYSGINQDCSKGIWFVFSYRTFNFDVKVTNQ